MPATTVETQTATGRKDSGATQWITIHVGKDAMCLFVVSYCTVLYQRNVCTKKFPLYTPIVQSLFPQKSSTNLNDVILVMQLNVFLFV